jgi:hypothetical protein
MPVASAEEVKSIERLAPVHEAQMITYLRLTGCTLGLILNVNIEVDEGRRPSNSAPTNYLIRWQW